MQNTVVICSEMYRIRFLFTLAILSNQSWFHFGTSHICKISLPSRQATGGTGLIENLAVECTKHHRTPTGLGPAGKCSQDQPLNETAYESKRKQLDSLRIE